MIEGLDRIVREHPFFAGLGEDRIQLVAGCARNVRFDAGQYLFRTGDPKAEARFGREIRALGRVEHPHLVKVFTSGAEGLQWFYAMELVEGADLAAVCTELAGSTAAEVSEDDWTAAVSTAHDHACHHRRDCHGRDGNLRHRHRGCAALAFARCCDSRRSRRHRGYETRSCIDPRNRWGV